MRTPASALLQIRKVNESMYRALPLFVMFVAVMFLLLFNPHGTSSQEEETCTTKEIRRTVVNRQLADLGCDNYTCGM